jgi:hypothetical protein
VSPGYSQSFSASYDARTKTISAVVVILLAAVTVLTGSALAAGLGAVALALAWAYSPRGYAILDRTIVVRRLIGNARIALEGVREVRTATADDFRGTLRLWGSGGLFGYYGIFQTFRLGKATWYLTDRSKAIVVVTEAKTTLYSPDNVDGFLAAIRTSVPVAEVAPAAPVLDAMRSYRSRSPIGKLVGLAVAMAAIGLVSFGLFYSPGPPGYTLTPESLTIHDRFYPVTVNAADVDFDRIRVVDLGVDKEWQPTARTNGFANAHYHSGWFRVAGGQQVRMYRADGRRLVLLPPKAKGTAVLLETGDPDKFVAELRSLWTRGDNRGTQ